MIDSRAGECKDHGMTPEKISARKKRLRQLKEQISDANARQEEKERAAKIKAKLRKPANKIGCGSSLGAVGASGLAARGKDKDSLPKLSPPEG
jgi:hypothetical protein